MRTLEQVTLKATDRKALQGAAAILRQRFPVHQVILFGSKARGDDDSESDIDILVLTDRPLTQAEKRQMTDALLDLELEQDVVISKLVIDRHEWEHGLYQVLPIRQEVEREGVAA